jgi:two-component system sensor histidine kinase KdpD
MLYRASETVSREVEENRLLRVLANELLQICQAGRCAILRRSTDGSLEMIVDERSIDAAAQTDDVSMRMIVIESIAQDQAIGFGRNPELSSKTLATSAAVSDSIGAYVPLRAQNRVVGVLHVGPRLDGREYSPLEERLIYTMANHAAIAITRQSLMAQAAQADALREADMLKEALLSLVSHELRTPLASIKASATGLLQQDSSWSDSERGRALFAINQEADRLTQVVNNLLDLSRLEAGAWKPARDWCDPGEIIGTVLDRVPPSDAERIHVRASDDLPFIYVDYVQIALVLTNLIENALKYSPPGSPVEVSIESGGDNRISMLTMSVRDHGSGIDPEEAAQLFTRFYRGAKHRRGEAHGMGLGLALCDAIVRAHGGHIEAANVGPDEPGAIFRFSIPTDKDEPSNKPIHTDDSSS